MVSFRRRRGSEDVPPLVAGGTFEPVAVKIRWLADAERGERSFGILREVAGDPILGVGTRRRDALLLPCRRVPVSCSLKE